MSADLDRLMADVDAILLDFDGPVCGIFAGHPAPGIAADLIGVLRQLGVDVPPSVATERDPLEVLRWTDKAADPSATRAVEDALCQAERHAADSAAPTPYGREVIVAARQAGMPVAVVSNNSAGAVSAYLAAHRLNAYVSPIIGRAYAEPDQMKPNPAPILRAVQAVGVPANRCVLVGDSLSDIEGARAAGVRSIAYANRPAKEEPFQQAGADAVITSMSAIARILIERAETA